MNIEKLAVSSKALKLYKPLLKQKNSYGVSVPLKRSSTIESNGEFRSSRPGLSIFSDGTPLSLKEIREEALPTSITIKKTPPSKGVAQKVKTFFKKPHLQRVGTLSHEIGHLDNFMSAKNFPEVNSQVAREWKSKAGKDTFDYMIDSVLSQLTGSPLTTRAEEIAASRKAIKFVNKLPLKRGEIAKIDQQLIKNFKTYSPKSKLTTFTNKSTPTFHELQDQKKNSIKPLVTPAKVQRAIQKRLLRLDNARTDSEKLNLGLRHIDQVERLITTPLAINNAKIRNLLTKDGVKIITDNNKIIDKKINNLTRQKGEVQKSRQQVDDFLKANF